MTKNIRARKSSGTKSKTGQARRTLYARCLERIRSALEDGYVLEAITLLESLITDRLEARLASIHAQKPEKRKFSTVGKLIQELSGKKVGESDEALAVYVKVAKWADKRNEAIHEFAKLREGSTKKWETKYSEARGAVEEGGKVFRELDKIVRKLNRKPVN